MLRSGYDNRYSAVTDFFSTQTRFKDLVDDYNSEEWDAVTLMPIGTPSPDTLVLINDYASGKTNVYDYGAYTVTTSNTGKYLTVITKLTDRFFASNGAKIFTMNPENGYGELIELQQ